MTPQSLLCSQPMPSLRTSSDKTIDDIGKTEKGQTEKATNNSTTSINWNKKSQSNLSTVSHNTKPRTILIGQQRIKFYCKTCMVDRLSNLNAPNSITEHTILSEKLTENISSQFGKEIEKLREIVDSLGNQLSNEENTNKRIAIYDALKEINGFITRYQNAGLGGFDKVKASEIQKTERLFENLPKALQDKTEGYKNAKQNLENAERETSKSEEKINQLQKQIKDYETQYENIIKKGNISEISRVQEIVAKNLEMLTALIQDNNSVKLGMSGNGIEQMFNILQGNAMSGWIINDIVPKLEEVDQRLANQLKPEGEDEILNQIQTLNNATRDLPMFSEIKLDSLLKNDDVKASTTVRDLIEFYETNKINIGIRGRSKQMPEPKSVRIPLEKNLQGDLANDPGLKNLFSPHPTCSRDAIPEDFLNKLNGLKDNSAEAEKKAAQAVLRYLKEQGVVKEENGNYESIQSFGGIIDDAGLPTYCSVSGTTTELLACLYYKADEDTQTHMKAAFEFLLNVARGEGKNVTIPNGFVKIFTLIALFMEAGQFHTSAEVLGGMYGTAVAWANLQAENSEPKDVQSMMNGFKNILNFYKEHMKEFWGQVAPAQIQLQN